MLIGLSQIKGIGYMFANSMLQVLKISPHQKIGNLTTEQISSIEKIIENPKASNFPTWFLNRRQDASKQVKICILSHQILHLTLEMI